LPPPDGAGIVLDQEAAVLRSLRLPPKTKLLALPFILRSYCFYYIAPTPIILSIGSSIVRTTSAVVLRNVRNRVQLRLLTCCSVFSTSR